MKVKAAAVGVVALPLALLFAFGGEEQRPDLAIAAGLDAKQVPAEYRTWVEKAGKTCQLIPAPVIAAQIEAESNWNPNAQSRTPSGEVIAQGISQFIPSTWKNVGMDVASKNGDPTPDGVADPFTPGDAIMTQGKYVCALAEGVDKRIKSGQITGDHLTLTLAAYNAGINAVARAGGVPAFPETQNYVRKIKRLMIRYSADGGNIAGFGGKVVAAAVKWKGTPYSWGGGTVNGPSEGFGKGRGIKGFDCSSLVQYAVYQASNGRMELPRTSQEQVKQGKPVNAKDVRPGDVIGFMLNGPGNFDHIGIYVGNGRIVHATKPGDVIKISDIRNSYYTSKPQTIRRFG